MNAAPKVVTVIVPCRNEASHIEVLCRSVLSQELPVGWELQLLIADGMSNDGTRKLLERMSRTDARIRCIDNPASIVSTGLNAALALAQGEIIVRMDVHTEYAFDYIAQCLAVLAETGADNVGGPWRAVPEAGSGPMQQAVAAAFQSRWVAGGAMSRQLDYDGWVDTVYLGCWPRQTFQRFGLFDETLVRNQDDEHNLRLSLGGGRVWQSSRVHSVYRPRASLTQLLRQYFQYGYWKPFVIRKHGQPAALRHFAPSVLIGLLGALGAAVAVGAPNWILWAGCLSYLGLVGVMTGAVAFECKTTPRSLALVPLVIVASHFGYGVGSIVGWWDVLVRGKGRERFSTLTR